MLTKETITFFFKKKIIIILIPTQLTSDSELRKSVPIDGKNHYHLFGILAVLISSVSSGFAGVYYEKLLKESSQPSIIIRNVQLGIIILILINTGIYICLNLNYFPPHISGLFSIIFAAAGVFINDCDKVVQRGYILDIQILFLYLKFVVQTSYRFFDGYTNVVWLVVALQVQFQFLRIVVNNIHNEL